MKKKLVIFSVLVAMLFAASIVGVSAATNTVLGVGTAYSAGLPIDLYYEMMAPGNQRYSTIVSNANVYYGASGASTSAASTGVNTGATFDFSFGAVDVNNAAYDVMVSSLAKPNSEVIELVGWSIDTPFALATGLSKLQTTLGFTYFSYTDVVTSMNVRYEYEMVYPDPNGTQDDRQTTGIVSYEREYPINYTPTTHPTYGSGYTASCYLSSFDVAQIQRAYDYLNGLGVDDKDIYISGIDATIPASAYELPNYWSRLIYLTDINRIDLTRDELFAIANESLAGLLYPDDIRYDHLDWTTWLTNSVKSFMNLEIVPGLPIWGIFSALMGVPILIWFLRMFAGG